MKKRFLPFSLLLVIMILGQAVMADGGHYVPRAKEATTAEAYLSSMRVNQHTGLVDPAWMIAASKKSAVTTRDDDPALVYWISMGPDNMGGRTTSVLYNKKNPKEVYIGSMGGGVFRTTNGISWHQVGKNLMVSCMEQAEDGTIYVGTGDGKTAYNYNGLSDIDYTNGFVGSGIYTIKDNVMSEEPLTGTDPGMLDNVTYWSFINDIAIDGETIVAATDEGIRYRSSEGEDWAYAMIYNDETEETDTLSGIVLTVKPIKDNTFVTAVNGKVYVGPLDNMVCRSAGNNEVLDSLNVITHIASAPNEGLVDVTACVAEDGSTVIYVALIDKAGKNTKVYCSRDMGEHWRIILPTGDTYNIYGSKGTYCNGMMVDPLNLDRLYILGIDLWRMDKSTENGYFLATKMSSTSRIHGMNDMAFAPNSNSAGYLATDGGIFKIKSNSDGFTYEDCNRGYTSTRCLNVIPTSDITRVVAGVLDHGPILIRGLENTNTMGTSELVYPQLSAVSQGAYSESYLSGSGAVSTIRPDVFILTINGGLKRTESAGELYDDVNFTSNQSFSYTGFRMPIALWETYEDENSVEEVWFKCTKDQKAGDVVQCFSHNGEYPFDYILPIDMVYDTANPDHSDSLLVPDPITAKLFAPNASGNKHNIFVTFDPLQFNKVADWYQIAQVNAYPTCMVMSNDGEVLFIGTKQGKLYRISNLRAVVDENTANDSVAEMTEITLPVNQCITSVAIYNEDNNKVVVTLGNYGNESYVLYSDNAMGDNPTFVSKQGTGLPLMPVYSSIYTAYKVDDEDAVEVTEHVLIGTEHGVYMTENIAAANPTWVPANTIMGDVPVLDMKQQNMSHPDQVVAHVIDSVTTTYTIVPGIHNQGVIYAATYGRGLFRCETYHTFYSGASVEENTVAVAPTTKVSMYPNPVHDAAKVSFELNEKTSVSYQVFDMSGRMVKAENIGTYGAGKHEISVSVDRLAKGAYFLRLNSGSQTSTAKFMVF